MILISYVKSSRNTLEILVNVFYAFRDPVFKLQTPFFKLIHFTFEDSRCFIIFVKSISHVWPFQLHVEEVIQLFESEHASFCSIRIWISIHSYGVSASIIWNVCFAEVRNQAYKRFLVHFLCPTLSIVFVFVINLGCIRLDVLSSFENGFKLILCVIFQLIVFFFVFLHTKNKGEILTVTKLDNKKIKEEN